MDKEEFIANVKRNLPEIPDQRDRDLIFADIHRLYEQGWSVTDSVSYLKCFEEVNSNLDEDIALLRMALIQKKYQK